VAAGGRAEHVLRLPGDTTPRLGEPRLRAATSARVLDAPAGDRIHYNSYASKYQCFLPLSGHASFTQHTRPQKVADSAVPSLLPAL
jgi:hypothetical protein